MKNIIDFSNIDITPLEKNIQEIKRSLRIELVSNTILESMWDMLIEKHHYLGSSKAMGPRLKYIVWYEDTPISAIGFNQAVYRLGVRERFINWSDKEKNEYLKHALNNNRFLILPWVKIKNLASHILSLAIKQVCTDWLQCYGSEPYIIETFVDKSKYAGTCYKASNWLYIGDTKGFKKVGKRYEYHGNCKLVFLYIINKNYKNIISCTGRPCQILKKWHKPLEMIYMQLQDNNWNSELLKDANIRGLAKNLTLMLKAHIEKYNECFYRVEQIFNANIYIKGLLSNIERKSIEPISLELNPSPNGVRNLQNFMRKTNWDSEKAEFIYQKSLSEKISSPNGMITIDESGNRKKGNNSVGVARQYCGSIGKVDNAQVGVYLGYSSSKGYGLLSSKLFMPEKWFGEDFQAKRKACHVPKDLIFKTKPQIATDLLKEIVENNLFKAKWVGVDCLYGNNKDFLKSIPEEYYYFADIPCNSKIWLEKPVVVESKNTKGTSENLKEKSLTPASKVSSVANCDNIPWKNIHIGESSKGPIYADVKCLRIHKDFSTKEGKFDIQDCWLFIRRRDDGEIRYSISNAPADIDETELYEASTMRWPIEQCFQEMKDQLGMDHCEARSWIAWHRHMLLVFIAHEFLLSIRMTAVDSKKNLFYH